MRSEAHPHKRTFNSDATAVAFPLGGIGTGNISIGACGGLRDWEIFNAPNKGFRMPNTFFALWARERQKPSVCKVIEGPLSAPHTLSHGYHPSMAAGLPRFRKATFQGEYPFAFVDFEDDRMPVSVSLEAFTPLIPLDAENSGLPCAILTYAVENTTADVVDLALAGSLINPIGGIALDAFDNFAAGGVGQNVNEFRASDGLSGIHMRSLKYQADALQFGDLSLTTAHPHVTYKRAWLRGAWYDFLQEFWNDFGENGTLTDLSYDTPSAEGTTDTASLAIEDSLQPGDRREYRFVLSWFFPNRPRSWTKKSSSIARNHYAGRFESSWSVASYVNENTEYLETQTRAFHSLLFSSTLPQVLIDAVSANVVPIRSTTCFWLDDGNFYGYEGCFDDGGCCDGTCTHVWSYAQTAAFLFPSLERNMRRTEFVVEVEEDGYLPFRTYKTFEEVFVWPWGGQKPEAAVDGQMGSILRVLREWQLSGDREWLAAVWGGVKRAIQFAAMQWDSDGDGVLDGRQHNTYDIEFYGPNPLCSIYYLAGLRAVEELAQAMGEPELAQKCRALFEAGSSRLDQRLWNGEYYVQQLEDVNQYKYQHGTGCLSDQLLAQLYARMLQLGDLLPADHVRSALNAIYRHNFKTNFSEHVNCQRTYVLNDEAGLLLCSWPRGGKPRLPFVYSDEVWTGVEYQVAAHLIYEGLVDEALNLVAAVRDRHDGKKRNPWDEVECGHHYARSMSSWALLIALCGFHYNAAEAVLTFEPHLRGDHFRSFFSVGSGWGQISQQLVDGGLQIEIDLQYGHLALKTLCLGSLPHSTKPSKLETSTATRTRLALASGKTNVLFDEPIRIEAGEGLKITLHSSA